MQLFSTGPSGTLLEGGSLNTNAEYGLTLTSLVTDSVDGGLLWFVSTEASIEIYLEDDLKDAASMLVYVTLMSDIDASDDVEHTFSFTITYEVIPCLLDPQLSLGIL